ncbi:ROK family glucokinase [Sporosalibacterium faouarense]|uniref:ROK family glucokinase n=1 Tax=Sporosalibacterium faouarense TaxID=516123 RepID=UPI00192CD118
MYIGVDLGGTSINIGVVDEKGKIKFTNSIATEKGEKPTDLVMDIIKLIDRTIKDLGNCKENIKAIGIGVPGIVNQETGMVINCVNLGWQDIPLVDMVENELGIPTFVDNDATLAGLAEYEVGVTKNSSSAVFITIGTGIGGGIIIDGKLQVGFNGVGSEIGHMLVGENYYDCNCGRNGCLETFASATALVNYTKKLINENELKTSIIDACGGNIDKINGKIIFQEATKGDKLANMALDRIVKYLGIGIMNIIAILDPEVIALGGGISNAGDFLLQKVKESVDSLKYFEGMPVSKITIAKLGSEAGIIGAAMLGKYKLMK